MSLTFFATLLTFSLTFSFAFMTLVFTTALAFFTAFGFSVAFSLFLAESDMKNFRGYILYLRFGEAESAVFGATSFFLAEGGISEFRD